ncbi:MAG TPA: type VI secretion system baseplate subunit TssK [Longimicrobiales bacterium]|nr:type VI secretion system baseplate subunit TssK [Longimicrobiales bacterium]
MRQTQGVLWSKGVLLTPQHLQIQDRFLEDTAEFRMSSLSSFPWGFTDLEIDRESLSEGSLALSRAAGLFRDGMAFDLPDSDPAPPAKPLEGLFAPDQEFLTLYLVMPARRAGERTVAMGGESVDTPFVARAIQRRDENTGLSEKPVMVAEKNFRLASENEYLEGSLSLPVARVRRADTGQFELDPDFVPPTLALRGSPYLSSVARRLVELLTAKSHSLSKVRRERGKGLASFGVSDVANFWLLYSTNRYLPEIRHFMQVDSSHPERLYASMLGLAGALSTFSSAVHPAGLPDYDHEDLSGCFGALDRVLRDLLDTVVPARFVSIQLEEARPAIFAAAIDHDRYLTSNEVYLAVSAKGTPPKRVAQLLKVASGDLVDRLVRQAVGGIGLRHVPEPGRDVPVKLDYLYFALDQVGEGWQAVRSARNIAVYVPDEIAEARLELVIMLPKAAAR